MPPAPEQLQQQANLSTTVRAGVIRQFLLLAFGILAAIEAVLESLSANWAVAIPVAITVLLTFAVLRLSRRPRFARLPERYAVIVLSAFLVIGGVTQWHHPANLVWLPLYPFAFYFLGGLRTGTRLSVLGLPFLAVTYFAFPSLQHRLPVPPAYAVQVLLAFGMSGLMAYFYERIRTRQQQLLNEQATADYLTGLPNRRGFFQVANAMAEQGKRVSLSFSIILLDLDNFKSVNDRFGHNAGDALLREVALDIQARVRSGDVLARWGGEEFVILVPQCNLEKAAALAEKLRTEIAEHRFATVAQVTASFGIAEAAPQEDIASIITRADRALYRAKRSGKNRVETEPPSTVGA